MANADDLFSIGRRSRCDQFGVGLNRRVLISITTWRVCWYAGCRLYRDAVLGTIYIAQQTVAETMVPVTKFGVTQNKETSMVGSLKSLSRWTQIDQV